MNKKKKIVYDIIIIVCVILIIISAVKLIDYLTIQKNLDASDSGKTIDDILTEKYKPIYIDGVKYEQIRGIKNYLIMGVDKEGTVREVYGNDDGGQADAIFVLSINNRNKTYSILQINRDTMTNVPQLDFYGNIFNTLYEQIALAHSYGNGKERSCLNTVKAVSDYLYGLNFTGYAAMNVDAAKVVNNSVGGVTVTIKDDFTASEPSMYPGAVVRLTDDQAYKYLRARMEVGSGTNVERMQRQFDYIQSYVNEFKAKYKEDSSIAINLFSSLEPYMVSNLDSDDFSTIIEGIQDYEYLGIFKIEGKSVVGEKFMEFYPDKKSLEKTVIDLYFVKS